MSHADTACSGPRLTRHRGRPRSGGDLVVKMYHKDQVSADAVRGFVQCPAVDAGERQRFRDWVNHLHRKTEPSRVRLPPI